MKLPLNSDQYLVLVTCIYVVACLIQVFVVQYLQIDVLQFIWIVALAAPLFLPLTKLVDLNQVWKKND